MNFQVTLFVIKRMCESFLQAKSSMKSTYSSYRNEVERFQIPRNSAWGAKDAQQFSPTMYNRLGMKLVVVIYKFIGCLSSQIYIKSTRM